MTDETQGSKRYSTSGLCPLIADAFEINGGEWRKAQSHRIGTIAPRDRLGAYAPLVAGAAAFVITGIRVQDFPIEAEMRNANAIAVAGHWREIADDDDATIGILAAAQKREDA